MNLINYSEEENVDWWKKIGNVENQLVIFNNVEHCYATATDCSSRVVINFNFIT